MSSWLAGANSQLIKGYKMIQIHGPTDGTLGKKYIIGALLVLLIPTRTVPFTQYFISATSAVAWKAQQTFSSTICTAQGGFRSKPATIIYRAYYHKSIRSTSRAYMVTIQHDNGWRQRCSGHKRTQRSRREGTSEMDVKQATQQATRGAEIACPWDQILRAT